MIYAPKLIYNYMYSNVKALTNTSALGEGSMDVMEIDSNNHTTSNSLDVMDLTP